MNRDRFTLQARLPDDLARALRRAAAVQRTTVSELTRAALARHLAEVGQARPEARP